MYMSYKKIVCLLACLVVVQSCTSTTLNSDSNKHIGPNREAAEINVQLGANYLREGELQIADQKLRRALKQDPTLPMAHWVFALLQEELGEDNLAENHFRKAINLDPKDPSARNNYGTFLCKQDRVEEAVSQFLTAAENPLYRNAGSAYTNAGICVLKKPDVVKAEEFFQKAIEINPEHRSALYRLAQLSFERQEYPQTMHYIQRYEKTARHNSASLWMAYQTTTNLGQQVQADVYAEQLKKKYPASKEARLLAESYWNAGKSRK